MSCLVTLFGGCGDAQDLSAVHWTAGGLAGTAVSGDCWKSHDAS